MAGECLASFLPFVHKHKFCSGSVNRFVVVYWLSDVNVSQNAKSLMMTLPRSCGS